MTSKELYDLLSNSGLDPEEAAEKLNVQCNVIKKWISGEVPIDQANSLLIRLLFDVNIRQYPPISASSEFGHQETIEASKGNSVIAINTNQLAFTLAEYASITRIEMSTAYKLAGSKKIPGAVKQHGDWLIPRWAIAHILDPQGEQGKPKQQRRFRMPDRMSQRERTKKLAAEARKLVHRKPGETAA